MEACWAHIPEVDGLKPSSAKPPAWASLVAQLVKNLPARQEIRVRSLVQDDTLKKETATHSSILAWEIPWTEEPGELCVHGVTKEVDMT